MGMVALQRHRIPRTSGITTHRVEVGPSLLVSVSVVSPQVACQTTQYECQAHRGYQEQLATSYALPVWALCPVPQT